MARKQQQHGRRSPTAKRGRSPSAAVGERPDRGRWSSRRKLEVVLRLRRGEELDAVSRQIGVSTARLAQWRDAFLAGGQAALKSRDPDVRDEAIQRLKAKVGELTMTNELPEEKIEILEGGLRPRPRRSSR